MVKKKKTHLKMLKCVEKFINLSENEETIPCKKEFPSCKLRY